MKEYIHAYIHTYISDGGKAIEKRLPEGLTEDFV